MRGFAFVVLFVGETLSGAFAAQGQVFRSAVQSVMVDVSVLRGHTPVADLTAEDFAVTDNGVTQHIDTLEGTAIPLDVSLVIDATWFTQGLAPGLGPAGSRSLQDNARQIANLLDAGDRLRIITFSSTVEEPRPMSTTSQDRDRISAANSTTWAFEDRPRVAQAVLTALTASVASNRRHVVFVFSSTRGALDMPPGDQLAEAAARTDALLYAVLNPPHVDVFSHAPLPFFPSEIPIRDTLTRAAEATGGKAFLTGEIVGAFRDVLKEFRQKYVLRYSLQGVPTRGWHNIVVKVPGCPGCTIQARRGYMGQ